MWLHYTTGSLVLFKVSLPSNMLVILQIWEKVAPLHQALTTSIMWGLKADTYSSSFTSSLASILTRAIRRAVS